MNENIKIYDTLSQKKLSFQPQKNIVTIYICGVTVYDECHIGHARTYAAFDTIIRYLESCNFKVKYVRNITDIDDKIIKRAQESNKKSSEISEFYVQQMQKNFKKLNLLSPSIEPKATDNIQEMIEHISDLIQENIAYQGKNGDVFFDISKFSEYGKLSHQKLDKLQSGIRIDIDQAKRNPLDFVLWKLAKPEEPAWSSPWGDGRPGWHVECSAMANKYLGETIDIHGGGYDLRFPHHENEIAQSESRFKQPFVKYWMHAGFLKINGEKMSKSLNNFLTVKDILTKYNVEVIRYFFISNHYRSEVNFSSDQLLQAASALDRIYNSIRNLNITTIIEDEQIASYRKQFQDAMNDDFNTPVAISVLFEVSKHINSIKEKDISIAQNLAALLLSLANTLGIMQQPVDEYFAQTRIMQNNNHELAEEKIKHYLNMRNEARNNKDWQLADEIRKKLLDANISIEDLKNGETIWRKI